MGAEPIGRRRIPSPRPTRHTAATNMLRTGVPLPEVSHILGHAGVEVTAKVYAHAVPRGAEIAWTTPAGPAGSRPALRLV